MAVCDLRRPEKSRTSGSRAQARPDDVCCGGRGGVTITRAGGFILRQLGRVCCSLLGQEGRRSCGVSSRAGQ